ncbi:protein of unknown function [Litoreibacter albidus]|uniref:DUF4123 domain-containing protein n=2 Tax=Litoreibacter albidus TaxID=670155 RepID=A0A1H3D3B7_9RHOB|nr:protein of unknown function [Litoreibacter albidus]
MAVPHGSDAPHVATLVAATAQQGDLANMARASLDAAGHRFIALDHVTPAQDHLRRHGETELIMALLSAVTETAPVQFSGFYPANIQAAPRSAEPVLTVEHLPLTPLDPDSKLPFWDRPWCPPELADILFDGPRRCFVVIDAATRKNLRGGFDIDALEMICDVSCLYNGAAAEDMREIAPYLVDITPFGQDGALIPAPLRDLFTKQWDGGACLFIRADTSMEALRRHLRHFLRIRSSDDADKWTFFRFWDPAVARVYFPGIATRPERVDRIFRLTPQLPLEIITGSVAQATRLFPREASGRLPKTAPITFDAQDHALMQEVADHAFRQETAAWLREAYPDRFQAFDPVQMDAAVAHIMAEGRRVKCALKDDYAFLAHVMLTLGGWFHISGHPADVHKVLRTHQGGLRAPLERAFMPAWEASPQAALMDQWDAVSAHITALPAAEQITPQAFTTFAQQFLPRHGNAVDAALAATKSDLGRLDLSQPDQGRLLVLTLVYGHRFYADPFRAWSTLPIADAINAAWADCFG